MQNISFKDQQRQYFKRLKKNISIENKNFFDNKIISNILTMKEYKESEIVMAYMANDIEVNIDDVIIDALKKNKMVAVPKCEKSDKCNMSFYFIDRLSDVKIGKYNIREPLDEINEVKYKNYCDKVTIMFVPGVVFSKQGYRIGYGKGYYDRYLQNNFKVLKVGLCYGIALIDNNFEDPTDVPMDIVITENQIIYFKRDI